jgi:DNA-binding MarR family transcriptional regulator
MLTQIQFNQVLQNWTEVFMRRSMREFVQFSKSSGLSMGQLSTLFRLYHRGGCGVSDIGEDLGVTNAAASQMIDRLVQQGLIQRAEDPNDRRVKSLTLTQKGRALVEESIAARRRWMEELTQTLSPQEQEAIIQGLTLLTEAALSLEPERVENR